MYMKVKYTCNCGCATEFEGSTVADRIYCANCGVALPEEDSAKVIAALKNVYALSEEYEGLSAPKLTFITSLL